MLLTTMLTGCPLPIASVRLIPQGSHTDERYHVPEPAAQWEVACDEVAGMSCNPSAMTLDARLTRDRSVDLGSLTLARVYSTLRARDEQSVPRGHCWGCTIDVTMAFGCGSGLATSFLGGVRSQPLVVPPQIHLGTLRIASDGGRGSITYFSPDAVPVALPFRLAGGLDVHPWADEKATVRMVGPGFDFTGTYGHDPKETSITSDDSVENALKVDPKAWVKASGPGTVRVWIEFEGTRSPEALLTLVESDSTTPNSGSGGAGGASGDDGDRDDPPAGCSSIGSPPVAAVLAGLWLVRRRRTAAQ